MRSALRRCRRRHFGIAPNCRTFAPARRAIPTRAITMIVPYPAGGPTDTLARVMGEPLKTALGQSVVIENVTGAGGSIGTGRVARSAPDGYTVGIGHNQTHVINAATQNLHYDVVKDFEPVTLIADTPIWLVGRRPAGQRREGTGRLAEAAGRQGTQARSASAARPTRHRAVLPETQTGTQFPAGALSRRRADAAGHAGRPDRFHLRPGANYLGPVRGGQLKAIAVLTSKRWWAAPDVPTMDEAGVTGIYASVLARPLGAEGHAEGRHRQAQRRGARHARRRNREKAVWTSARRSGRPISRRRRRSPPSRRPRSNAGGRSSRPPASSRNNPGGVR